MFCHSLLMYSAYQWQLSEFNMVLNIHSFSISCPVEHLLSIRLSHVSTPSPFHLNRVSSILGCPSHGHTQACNVNTVECDMASHKLVLENPVEFKSATHLNQVTQSPWAGQTKLDSSRSATAHQQSNTKRMTSQGIKPWTTQNCTVCSNH